MIHYPPGKTVWRGIERDNTAIAKELVGWPEAAAIERIESLGAEWRFTQVPDVTRFTKATMAILLTLLDQLSSERLVLDDHGQPESNIQTIEAYDTATRHIREAYCVLNSLVITEEIA